VELKAFIASLFIVVGLAAPQQCVAQSANSTAQQKKLCTVQSQEIEVFDSYLKEGIASPQVLVTKTASPHVDVDTLNLQLAAQGRGIPPDVRTDFKEKNKSSCLIKSFTGIPNPPRLRVAWGGV
jgi:hypothetical protein